MKRAIIVTGSESSGTKLMVRLFQECGAYGWGYENQPFDTEIPQGEEVIVWRRSAPSGQTWPHLPAMIARVRTCGYNPFVVLMIRDWYPTQQSQIKRGYIKDGQSAVENLRLALLWTVNSIMAARTDYVVVTYEGLVRRPVKMANWLSDILGLRTPDPETVTKIVFDADEPHWEWYDPDEFKRK